MEERSPDEIIEPKPVKAIGQFLLIPAGPLLYDPRIFPCFIGLLSKNDRAAKIRRYIEKKNKRKSAGHIRYHCRQSLAVKRSRLNGRFVKSNSRKSTEDDETLCESNPVTCQDSGMLVYSLPA